MRILKYFSFFKLSIRFDFIHYLQLFASGLQQKLEMNDGILGYLEADIKKEIKRASKLVRILHNILFAYSG